MQEIDQMLNKDKTHGGTRIIFQNKYFIVRFRVQWVLTRNPIPI